jgi:hypothetical protein
MARLDRRNVTRYWWDKHVPGLSLLHADFTAHDYPAHAHDAFVIAVTELGGARIKSRHVEEAVGPATLFISNPAEPQSAAMGDSPRWRYRSIYLARPAIDALARDLGLAQTECREDRLLQTRIGDAQRPAAQLDAVQHEVVSSCL